MKNVTSAFLVILTLIVGIFLLVFGFSGIVSKNGYEPTPAYLVSSDENRLTYEFYAGNRIYTVTVEGEEIPERTVLYRPENPDDAYVQGEDNSGLVLFVGFLFTAVGSLFLLLTAFDRGKVKVSVADVAVGAVLLASGIGVFFIFGIVISIVFILCGIYLIARGITNKRCD